MVWQPFGHGVHDGAIDSDGAVFAVLGLLEFKAVSCLKMRDLPHPE